METYKKGGIIIAVLLLLLLFNQKSSDIVYKQSCRVSMNIIKSRNTSVIRAEIYPKGLQMGLN